MFRVGHSPGQEEYLRWKHQMLAPFSRPVGPMGRGLGFDTYSFPTLLDLRQDAYGENGARKAAPSLLNRLDAIVAEAGGRVYPAKDNRMSAAMFQASYPRWRDLEARRDPAFQSAFWRRVTQ